MIDPDLLSGRKEICRYLRRDHSRFNDFMDSNPDFPAYKIGAGSGSWESSKAAISIWRLKKMMEKTFSEEGSCSSVEDLVSIGLNIVTPLLQHIGGGSNGLGLTLNINVGENKEKGDIK